MEKKSIISALLLLFSITIWGQNNVVTLGAALNSSTSYLKQRLPAKSKVIVLNFVSNFTDLSDYIIEELTTYIVNDNNLTVVDRSNLEAIQQEMKFQLSGEVSDETAQAIGKKIGAQTIITGSIVAIGATYRLRIRAIEVETAAIQGMYNVNVAQDSTIAALTSTGYAMPTITILNPSQQKAQELPAQNLQKSQSLPTTPATTPKPEPPKPGPNSGNEDYILPYSSTRELANNDLRSLTKQELRLARNEIYARHGRVFKDQALQRYFDSKSWYKNLSKLPLGTEPTLTKLERSNIELIQAYEAR
jgi:TolB-like protein